MARVNVNMIVKMTTEGEIFPYKILWEDGRVFEIEKITDKRKMASLKAGGCGVRYTCKISGAERYIYLDNGIWFLEGK